MHLPVLLHGLSSRNVSMQGYPDTQDILETWRLRTPNEWEQLTVWSDVLTWRNAIYNVIINAFKHMGELAPHLHQLGYKDKAWYASTSDVHSLRCILIVLVARSHSCHPRDGRSGHLQLGPCQELHASNAL